MDVADRAVRALEHLWLDALLPVMAGVELTMGRGFRATLRVFGILLVAAAAVTVALVFQRGGREPAGRDSGDENQRVGHAAVVGVAAHPQVIRKDAAAQRFAR